MGEAAPHEAAMNEDLRARMVRKRHAIDLMELSFAEDAARYAETGDYDELGFVSGIDWIRFTAT